jgi:hypothetical protein
MEEVGSTAPPASLCTLTFIIDGKKMRYGLYTVLEHVDNEFQKKRYGKDHNDSNLYKCPYLGDALILTPESLAGEHVGVKD